MRTQLPPMVYSGWSGDFLPASGYGFQQEVELIVLVRHPVFGERLPSPAVHAAESGLEAFYIDVRASVGHEVARVSDVLGRTVVELRNGVGDCRS